MAPLGAAECERLCDVLRPLRAGAGDFAGG
jgi:hypothetical protein